MEESVKEDGSAGEVVVIFHCYCFFIVISHGDSAMGHRTEFLSIGVSIFGILIFMFSQHYYLKVLKFGDKKGCRYETRKTFTNKKFPLGRLSGELTSAALAQPN